VQMEKKIAACVGHGIERYETHDIDGQPDRCDRFLDHRIRIWLARPVAVGRPPGSSARRTGGKTARRS
jgi:hypothetical protein